MKRIKGIGSDFLMLYANELYSMETSKIDDDDQMGDGTRICSKLTGSMSLSAIDDVKRCSFPMSNAMYHHHLEIPSQMLICR